MPATPGTAHCCPPGEWEWSSAALCSSWWPAGHRCGMQLFCSTALIGGAYLAMAAAGSLAVACAVACVGGIGNGVQWVTLMSAVQELTAERFQARVVGLLESIGRMMPGVGFILGGVIAAVLSPRASFVAAGAGVLTVLAVAMPLLRRAEWSGPGPEGADGPAGDAVEPLNV